MIPQDTDPEVRIVICIPVFAEPNVFTTLTSIIDCERIESRIEVIILFNKGESISSDDLKVHQLSWTEVLKWMIDDVVPGFIIYPLYVDQMPDGKGGVGWARKVAMDEAARRLQSDGVIVCLDADCIVSPNFLVEIEKSFRQAATMEAASIYYEHPLVNLSFEEDEAIINYELHLRYLVQAQRWSGHPFAFHTVGSSMAIRRRGYLSQGGMNTRQAGEDFYLLQKFIETGTLFEINTTTVFPSSRISSRVPFGTGRAMQQQLVEKNIWRTTHFNIFKEIKPLFDAIERLRLLCLEQKEALNLNQLQSECSLSNNLMIYLDHINFKQSILEISRHTSGNASFRKRFFRFFNAFRMIKYSHYMRDSFYPDVDVEQAVSDLLTYKGFDPGGRAKKDLLIWLRKMDQEGSD